MESSKEERYRDLARFLDQTYRSGWLDDRYIIEEMAKLIGLDATKALRQVRNS
jgi:hypothetical protein